MGEREDHPRSPSQNNVNFRIRDSICTHQRVVRGDRILKCCPTDTDPFPIVTESTACVRSLDGWPSVSAGR